MLVHLLEIDFYDDCYIIPLCLCMVTVILYLYISGIIINGNLCLISSKETRIIAKDKQVTFLHFPPHVDLIMLWVFERHILTFHNTSTERYHFASVNIRGRVTYYPWKYFIGLWTPFEAWEFSKHTPDKNSSRPMHKITLTPQRIQFLGLDYLEIPMVKSILNNRNVHIFIGLVLFLLVNVRCVLIYIIGLCTITINLFRPVISLTTIEYALKYLYHCLFDSFIHINDIST